MVQAHPSSRFTLLLGVMALIGLVSTGWGDDQAQLLPKPLDGFSRSDASTKSFPLKGTYTQGEASYTVTIEDNPLGVQAVTMIMDQPSMLGASKSLAEVANKKVLITREFGETSLQVPLNGRFLVTFKSKTVPIDQLKAAFSRVPFAALEAYGKSGG